MCIGDTSWDHNFCPYYGGFFYHVLDSKGLLKEVPLYILLCYLFTAEICLLF